MEINFVNFVFLIFEPITVLPVVYINSVGGGYSLLFYFF